MLPTLTLYTEIQAASKFLRDPSLRWKIECLLQGLKSRNVTLACRQAGIHRTTFYKWLHRLVETSCDPEALRPRSRRPLSHPRTIAGVAKQRIVWFRKTFQYGPDRIEWYLKQEGLSVSSNAVYNVLKRASMPFRKRKDQKKNPHVKRFNLDRPGQGIQLDVKYVPFPIEGRKAYVFNAIDDCSRWRFQYVYRQKGLDQALDFLPRLIAAAPFRIEQIQTDNDSAFTDRFLRTPRLEPSKPHPFPGFLASKGIRHKLIPPGIKELNGKVERSHKTDDQEFYWRLPCDISWSRFQSELARWTFEYNHCRPHSSLKMKTPAQRLEDFEIYSFPRSPWPEPPPPTHHTVVSAKLDRLRALDPNIPFLQWKAPASVLRKYQPGPRGPRWLPQTPSAIKALSLMNGETSLSYTGRPLLTRAGVLRFQLVQGLSKQGRVHPDDPIRHRLRELRVIGVNGVVPIV
jgi:transposase InsO family protein